MQKIWAIIPVKLLEHTKSRLTAVLTLPERAELTQQLVRRTLAILRDVPEVSEIVVVSRDMQVAKMALKANVYCIPEARDGGLNNAVSTGYTFANKKKADFALVIPSDLAFLTPFDVTAVSQQAHKDKIIIAPDQIEDGTNALLLPTGLDFRFQYGRSSFDKHLHEAQQHKRLPQVIYRANLQFDLDTAQDFTTYQNQQSAVSPQLSAISPNKI